MSEAKFPKEEIESFLKEALKEWRWREALRDAAWDMYQALRDCETRLIVSAHKLEIHGDKLSANLAFRDAKKATVALNRAELSALARGANPSQEAI